jgi:CheY-like chemotaxis protein
MKYMKVLFVDDDPDILSLYKKLLQKQFQIETALDGKEGLATLNELGPFAVVVADMHMPDMDGINFLTRVKEISPDSVRIMLTGNADLHTAMDAVNEGNVFRFLIKPCSSELLEQSLNAGLRQYQLITAERELTRETLVGSVRMLMNVINQAEPAIASRANRITRYTKMIATQMQLPNLWEIELASMLSQLGCLILPPGILRKLNSGYALSLREKMMYSSHPSLGANVVTNIPRLESMSRMIGQQLKPFKYYVPAKDVAHEDRVSLGAQIIRIAIGLDQMLTRGLSYEAALARMQEDPDEYNPEILKILRTGRIDMTSSTTRYEDVLGSQGGRTVSASAQNESVTYDDTGGP